MLSHQPEAEPGARYPTHPIAVPRLPAGEPLSTSALASYVERGPDGVVKQRLEVPMTQRSIARVLVDQFGFPDGPRSASAPTAST